MLTRSLSLGIQHRVQLVSNSQPVIPIIPLEYFAGTKLTGITTITGDGTTSVSDIKLKEGTASNKVTFLNAASDNFIDIVLPSNVAVGDQVGIWMFINYAEQMNMDNVKFSLCNGEWEQTSLAYWGEQYYTTDANSKEFGYSKGDWQYVTIKNDSGNPINRIRVTIQSSVTSNANITDIYIDNVAFVNRKIKPVIMFNLDSAYAEADAIDDDNGGTYSIYELFTEFNMPYTITGTIPSINFNKTRLLNQISAGILEVGTYGGEIDGTIITSTNYNEILSAVNALTAKKIADGFTHPKVFGTQFSEITPDIFNAVKDGGYKVIRGGIAGWYSFAHQQIFAYDGSDILQLSLSEFGAGITSTQDIIDAKAFAKQYIDLTIAYGSAMVLFNHNFAKVPTSNLFTNAEIFQ